MTSGREPRPRPTSPSTDADPPQRPDWPDRSHLSEFDRAVEEGARHAPTPRREPGMTADG